MLVLTFVSNRAIILPMEHDRQLASGNISIMMPDSPIRQDFDARHQWSTKVEGTILLLGIGLAVLIGFEAGLRERISTAPPKRCRVSLNQLQQTMQRGRFERSSGGATDTERPG